VHPTVQPVEEFSDHEKFEAVLVAAGKQKEFRLIFTSFLGLRKLWQIYGEDPLPPLGLRGE
jgi:hypothetical protein